MSQANPNIKQTNDYVTEYIKHGNQAKAFKAAFPDTIATPNSIRVNASRIHRLPNIQLTISKFQKKVEEIAKEKFNWDTEARLGQLLEVVEDGMTGKDSDCGMRGRGDVIRALNEANKMTGEHAPIKQESDIKVSEVAAPLNSKEVKIFKKWFDAEF